MRVDSVGLGVGGSAANRPIELFNSTRGLIRTTATATTGTDAVAGIEMFAYDGSAVTTGASIVMNYSLQATDPNALVLATSRAAAPMIFKTAGTERTRIDGSGDITHLGQIILSRGGNSTISRGNVTGYLSLSGGSDLNTGPNIQLGGASSATFANLMVFRNGSSNLGVFTSGGSFIISPTATSATGTEKLLVSTTSAGASATLAVLQNLGTTVGTGVSLNFATATNGGTGVTLGGINVVAVGAVTTGNAAGDMAFSTTSAAAASEKMRLTSLGILTVGSASATTPRAIEVPGGGTAGSTHVLNIETQTSNQYPGITIVRNDDVTAQLGASITLARTRGAVVGSNTVAVSGDTLGAIGFAAADGTDIRSRAAEILGYVEGTVGASVTPGRLVFATSAAGSAVPTERMRIDSAGNVGIGTSATPGAKLDVVGDIGLLYSNTDTDTLTTTSTTQTALDTWAIATYRSAKYEIQISSGTSYHVTEVRIVQDGTTAYHAEYGEMLTGASLGSFAVDISAGNARLLFTAASATSTTVRFHRVAMKV
jgi:hypothetical protein